MNLLGVKLKNISVVENLHQIDACTASDDGQMITKAFNSLSIRLEPEDDLPHPRHLCFRYPFGKSSPKRHCSKCYCYVCEEIAPCKMWKKTPRRHCNATDKDDKWRSERKLRKKLPGRTTMVHHKLAVSASNHFPDGRDAKLRGFAGGLICDNDGKWVIGISMRLLNNIDPRDCSVSYYTALLEGLQLAWSRGFRCLEVKLGFGFHDGFWTDFSKDAVTRKLRLCVDPCSSRATRTMAILKSVEDYLNRKWFINVNNTEAVEEETGALTLAMMAEFQEQAKKVYDYRTHPLPPEIITRDIMSATREMASHVFDKFPEGKKYFGLN